MSRAEDLLLLLTVGLAFGCEPAVEPGDDAGPSGQGEHAEAVQAAVEVCEPFVRHFVDCAQEEVEQGGDVHGHYNDSVGYVSVMGYCIAQVGYSQHLGDDCVAAYDDYFACLATADCGEFFGAPTVSTSDDDEPDDDGGGADDEESPAPCAAEEERVELACDGPSVEAVETD